MQRRKTSEWKKRHVSDALFGKSLGERIILPVSDIVEGLDANDRRDRLRLGDLLVCLAATVGGFHLGLLLMIAVSAGTFACVLALPAHSLHDAHHVDPLE